MQIDFHHAVTYVAARIAGFTHDEADIVAYAAQYVDDATCDGAICFDNRALYKRISSSHKNLDLENLDPVQDLMVWMPFHFLPGNGGADSGDDPEGKFIHKLVCLPGSPVAQEMVRTAILDHEKPYSLHRLGITMHVFADTWAHQGFAGVCHEINNVEDFDEIGNSEVFEGGPKDFLNRILQKAIPPLGHAKASIFPDMPFLSWKYRNGNEEPVERDNTKIFCKAADALCRAMQEYRRHTEPTVQVTGIGTQDMDKIRKLFSTLKNKDGAVRHEGWLNAIAGSGAEPFSFGTAKIKYSENGPDSWKAVALGDGEDQPVFYKYTYTDAFLDSNWKHFHDALQLHRLTVAHDILPKYGICAA